MIEIVKSDFPHGPFQAAVFDFDGTLSLLRRNWQDVMIPMMVKILAATNTSETTRELQTIVEEFVMRLNGRQTIYQMIRLAEEVAQRGTSPQEPLDYKRLYHDLLWKQVGDRVAGVREGRVDAETMTVPGIRPLLERMANNATVLYLASGTDLHYVQEELRVLQLDEYFEERVYGALDDYKSFSKAKIVNEIVVASGVPGPALIGFGDGFVEIEEVQKVGGLAVGVASNEDTRTGINDWKRNRLIQAGAHLIIGDYRDLDELAAAIGI